MTLRDLAGLLLVADDTTVRDAVFALARDRKRDRGVRQIAIAYLIAAGDPRGDALVTDVDVLTPQQRLKLRPAPPPASGAPGEPPAPPRPRRRHHH